MHTFCFEVKPLPNMEYKTFFDVENLDFSWSQFNIRIILLVVSIVAYNIVKRKKQQPISPPSYQKSITQQIFSPSLQDTLKLAIAFFGFFLVFGIGISLYDMYKVKDAIKTGKVKIVTGKVSNYQLEQNPSGKIGTESFYVEDIKFEYSDSETMYRFHQTSLNGGPVHEGMKVRIHYFGMPPVILKLELSEELQ